MEARGHKRVWDLSGGGGEGAFVADKEAETYARIREDVCVCVFIDQ